MGCCPFRGRCELQVVKSFVSAVKDKALGEVIGVNPEEQFIKIVHDELANVWVAIMKR